MSGAFATELGTIGENEKRLTVDNFETAVSSLARRHRVLMLKGVIVGYPGSPGMGRSDYHSPAGIFTDIMAMNYEDPETPITLIINSEGGLVQTGLQLYDAIKLSKAPIRTIGINCASMATVLLAAGAKRYAFPHSRFMLHLLSGKFEGDYKEIDIQHKEIKKIQKTLTDCYIECGVNAGLKSKNPEVIRRRLMKDVDDGDLYLNAEEAIEYGLVDGIVTTEELFNNE